MSDLYDILVPHFDGESSTTPASDRQTSAYLDRLHTLSLADLTNTETSSLQYAAQSHLRNLQALSKRSHKAVIASSGHLANLASLLPGLRTQSAKLQDGIPQLENAATEFVKKYDRSTDNAVLDRRKQAMLLARNVDRVTDVLDLPTLLLSTVNSAQTSAQVATSSSATSYASALDLHGHIKRLNNLYPQSKLVGDISKQAEGEIDNLTTILITSLQSPSLKLAAAIRTIGWLRRVAPDLANESSSVTLTSMKGANKAHESNEDGALGSLFLICRLHSLHTTLSALEPLRELADQESNRRQQSPHAKQTSSAGSQSERYLKRYIEIFREQSFAITSMYKSVFPNGLPTATVASQSKASPGKMEDPLLPLPSPLASFTLHLADLLTGTLRDYMPNITDQSTRESLLTQVLYCASSLGRLGADFGMLVALVEEDMRSTKNEQSTDKDDAEDEREWVQVMKKHRVQAGRLEVLARGVGTAGRKGSADVMSPAGVTA